MKSRRTFLAAVLVAACNKLESAGPTFLEVSTGAAHGYIVSEVAARADQGDRVWVPDKSVVAEFEQDLVSSGADFLGYQRQYIGTFDEDRRALKVLLYCPSMARDYPLDRGVPVVHDGCRRFALYDPESRRLKVEGYPPFDPTKSTARPAR